LLINENKIILNKLNPIFTGGVFFFYNFVIYDIMEEVKCNDCGSDDVYVKITTTKDGKTVYQCSDCYEFSYENIKTLNEG
jgi:DNA-directed RNA polymerase subunit RPC12/RpoP